MRTYISLLRGINVSGQKSIKMNALSESYERLGFANIKTYLQSGNVIFDVKEQAVSIIKERISQQIKLDFGYDVPVIVLDVDGLQQIVSGNPFLADEGKDQSFFHVTFLSPTAQSDNFDEVEKKKQGNEEILLRDNTIYLYCPNGYGKTKLTNNFIESKLKTTATTRNWKTVTELLKIASQ